MAHICNPIAKEKCTIDTILRCPHLNMLSINPNTKQITFSFDTYGDVLDIFFILNSKTVIGTTSENGVKEIELVSLSCGLLSFSHPYDGCALYLFSTFYDTSAGHISPIKENSRINSVTLNGSKLIMNTSINFTFCCYVYTYR